jgi:hypothetical protein
MEIVWAIEYVLEAKEIRELYPVWVELVFDRETHKFVKL